MRWILKIILFPISLLLSILTAFLTFLLAIGTTILYLLMLMCIVVGVVSLFQKDFSMGIEALILGFLLSPYGIPMVGATVIAFLKGINEAIKSIKKNFIKMVSKDDRKTIVFFFAEFKRGGETMDFDYFYNREVERFNFLKVPDILVDGEEFKGLSAEAIILYSMLLKRTGMSFKNNWIDKEGRVFIYFTVEEIMKRRNISKPTAIKTLDELDVKKGIGLIERVRLGLGKPNIIYVKDFMSVFQVKENG